MSLNQRFSKLNAFIHLIRYWQWQEKIQTITIAGLLLLIYTQSFFSQHKNLLILIFYLHVAFSYGYLLNSLGDRQKDLLIGRNHFGKFSENFIKILLIILGCATLAIPLIFRDTRITAINVFCVFLASVYSLKPWHLKERGGAGLLVATLTQRLPFLFFLSLLPNHTVFILFLFGWLLLVSLLVELAHQSSDYNNDVKTQTHSFLTRIGKQKAIDIIRSTFYLLIVYLALPIILCPVTYKLPIVSLSAILFIFSHNSIQYALSQISHLKRE